MKFGLSMFTTDYSASPTEVAKAAEANGFESFWVSEHSNIPVDTDFPMSDTVPREYSSMLDPFVALAAAATVTERINLGTAICLVTQRDPINCAKLVASIDQLSGGRMLFGIGAGWNEPEMRNHGTDPNTRFRLMRERVEAMNPPVIVAGAGPNVLKRVIAYGEGWLPVVTPAAPEQMKGRVTPMDEFVEMAGELERMADAAGRPTPAITVSGMNLDAATFDAFAELGVERMILRLTTAPLDDVLAQIEQHVKTVRSAGGSLH
jgi:alkanesulfonate monooxygenase SsuD/methylene tetrahydromethanopterin reductase-like flavin-dependent oxidoreductase (luciferase family)